MYTTVSKTYSHGGGGLDMCYDSAQLVKMKELIAYET
jgi:hypothetical protein